MSPRERTDPDSWRAETPATAATWLAGLSVPWWIAGGWTIDLFLGAQTRAHSDVDVGIRRADLAVVRAHLSTWEMFEAKDGVLTRLQEGVGARGDVHSLWCRPAEPLSGLWS
jgi:hypothetical protein